MGGNQARAREIWVHRADDGVILNEPIFIPPFIHLYSEFEKPHLLVLELVWGLWYGSGCSLLQNPPNIPNEELGLS